MANIKIPFTFVRVGDAFAWLLNAQGKTALEAAVSDGVITQDALDLMVEQDKEARELPGVFDGDLIFERPTMATGNVIYAEASRRVREQASAERDRAEALNIRPRFTASSELVNVTAHQLRPELTYMGAEGTGAEAYARWDSIPDAVKAALPDRLAEYYVLGSDLAAVLKKKPQN